MEDEDRVFKAVFPDTRRRQKLNDEEWRIFMLPLEFILLSVRPVVDMRITLKEPTKATTGSSGTASRLLTLEATRWELRGLEHVVNPSDFNLGVVGYLYPEKGGPSPRLKGRRTFSKAERANETECGSCDSAFPWIGQALLSQLLENMKERVNTRLLQDYKECAEQEGIF